MSSLGEIGSAPSDLHCRRCWCAVRDVCPSRSATRVGTVSFPPSVSSPPSAPRRAVVSDGQESKGVSLPHSLSRLQDGCRCTTSLRLLTPPRARAFPLLSPARRFSARLLTKTGISQVGLARSVAAGRVVTSASGSVSSSRNPLESRRTRAQLPTTRVRCVPTACWSFYIASTGPESYLLYVLVPAAPSSPALAPSSLLISPTPPLAPPSP